MTTNGARNERELCIYRTNENERELYIYIKLTHANGDHLAVAAAGGAETEGDLLDCVAGPVEALALVDGAEAAGGYVGQHAEVAGKAGHGQDGDGGRG